MSGSDDPGAAGGRHTGQRGLSAWPPTPPHSLREMQSLEVMEGLGEGTYGRVFKARTAKGQIVCVKQFKPSDSDAGMLSVSTLRELQALRELDHPNIIK